MPNHRVLVLSDAHFFDPRFYAAVIRPGERHDPPSRLSTELALGDKKANPFHALILLAREERLLVDTLVCCGDLTTCADPTAMNLGWLQLHRLAAALRVDFPIVTAGNHDIDSRFQTSGANPNRMLRFMDPPFPVEDGAASASYWANGYCIIDRASARFVLVNTCSLHGYATEEARQSDHGFFPETVFQMLREDLDGREERTLNFLVCHHHPVAVQLLEEDDSIISNAHQLIEFFESLAPPNWIVLHGHRHLPAVRYAGPSANAPLIFSAGSLAVNLHLALQDQTQNQFYVLDVDESNGVVRGLYSSWTWDSHEGEWLEGIDTRALAPTGGFGYRPDPAAAAALIASLVPPHNEGPITWRTVEDSLPDMRFLLPDQIRAIVAALVQNHGIAWETDTKVLETSPSKLRLGRQP